MHIEKNPFPQNALDEFAFLIQGVSKPDEIYPDMQCPFSLEVMDNPLIAADCHSYGPMIAHHYNKPQVDKETGVNYILSPITREIIEDQSLKPNYTLKKLIGSIFDYHKQLTHHLGLIQKKLEAESLSQLVKVGQEGMKLSKEEKRHQINLISKIFDSNNPAKYLIKLGKSFPQLPILQKEMFLLALKKEPHSTQALGFLAGSLGKKETIELFGEKSNKRAIYQKLIEIEPNNGSHYYNLATTLLPGETIMLNHDDLSLSEADLCFIALEKDPSIPFAWNNLGTLMNSQERVKIGGKQYDQRECFLKAFELDSTYAIPLHNLGNTLASNEKIQLPLNLRISYLNEDRIVSRPILNLIAIDIDPNYSKPYYAIASILNDREKIRLYNKCIMSKKELLKKAIFLEPTFARAWQALAEILTEDETIEVLDSFLSRKQIACRAEELAKNNLT
jgi:hypothetical protein